MGGRPRWVDAVVVLDAIVGAALAVIGAYLIEPGRLDLGFYLDAARYRLAGGVLVYAGLVLGYAAVFGLRTPIAGLLPQLAEAVLGTSGRFWCAAILLVFAGRAATAGWPVGWVALIAMPGVLAALSLRFASIARARSTPDSASARGITADTGKRAPFAFGRFLWRGATFAIALGASIFVLACALFAYVLLDAAFIGGRRIDLDFAVEVLARNLAPLVAAIAGITFGMVILVGVAAAIGDRVRRRREADLERDLSPEEVSFATRCAGQIRDYVAEHDLAAAALRAGRASRWTFGAFGAAGIVLFLEVDRVIAALHAPAGEAWHLYLVTWPDSNIVALAAMLSLAFLPRALANILSRRAAEASGARLIKADGVDGALEAQIVARVRDRSLAPGSPFDAGDLLRTLGVTTAVFALVWNALVAAGIAAWWPHDRARDTLYTERGIETGGFWTLERRAYAYASVASVHLRCETLGNGAGAIGYMIVLPGDVRRELFVRRRLTDHLDEAAKVDAKLREAGVMFHFALPESAPAHGAVVDRRCVTALTQGMDGPTRARVEDLFHLDEWFERRWRLRTGKAPRIAGR